MALIAIGNQKKANLLADTTIGYTTVATEGTGTSYYTTTVTGTSTVTVEGFDTYYNTTTGYVTVDTTGQTAYSSNAQTWTLGTALTGNYATNVAHNSTNGVIGVDDPSEITRLAYDPLTGTYVYVSHSGYTAYSLNGTTWTAGANINNGRGDGTSSVWVLPSRTNINVNVFTVVNVDGIYESADGITWNKVVSLYGNWDEAFFYDSIVLVPGSTQTDIFGVSFASVPFYYNRTTSQITIGTTPGQGDGYYVGYDANATTGTQAKGFYRNGVFVMFRSPRVSGASGYYATTKVSVSTNGINFTEYTPSSDNANAYLNGSAGTKFCGISEDGTIWAINNLNILYTSNNLGVTWTFKNLGSPSANLPDSSARGKYYYYDKMYANNNNFAFALSRGGGSTKIDANKKHWQSVAMSSDGTKVYAIAGGADDGGGSSDGIWISSNSGHTFTNVTISSGSHSRSYMQVTSSSDGTKVAVVDFNGYIYTSTNSGVTWTERSVPNSGGNSGGVRGWYSITSSADGTKLAAAAFTNHIFTSTDSGATWTARTAAGQRYWRCITSSADGTKLAATVANGYIYTSTDSGVTWTERTAAGQRYWLSITSSADGTKLAAVIEYTGGNIWTSTDSGVTWTERTASGHRNWQGITSSSDGTKLAAVPEGGYIWTSTDSGVTWTERTASGYRHYKGVVMSADGTKIVYATSNYNSSNPLDGYLVASYDSGLTWKLLEADLLVQEYYSSEFYGNPVYYGGYLAFVGGANGKISSAGFNSNFAENLTGPYQFEPNTISSGYYSKFRKFDNNEIIASHSSQGGLIAKYNNGWALYSTGLSGQILYINQGGSLTIPYLVTTTTTSVVETVEEIQTLIGGSGSGTAEILEPVAIYTTPTLKTSKVVKVQIVNLSSPGITYDLGKLAAGSTLTDANSTILDKAVAGNSTDTLHNTFNMVATDSITVLPSTVDTVQVLVYGVEEDV